MKTSATTYIALGSNQGRRFAYLQKAVDAIFEGIGRVLNISSIYETPSWGFEGADFLNACLRVKTYCSAEEVLEKLLAIEQKFGRKRSENGYTNRTLDLDILFYDQQKIQTERLNVPHPRLIDRLFVLQPLHDIAPDFVHPDNGKSVAELLSETPDKSDLRQIERRLKLPKIEFNPLNFLAIEGNIGAGKTSLAQLISEEFNAKLITERYKDNPFLPKFYKNQARYAFPLEMSFLADRYQQLIDNIAQYDLFNDFMVSDYDIYKSMIFAQVTLPKDEILLYKQLFAVMYKDLVKPDLYVYLYQKTERLLDNIKKRGRKYEQNIPSDYLDKINRGYLNFIKTEEQFKVKIVDISELDFVSKREDFLKVIRQINT